MNLEFSSVRIRSKLGLLMNKRLLILFKFLILVSVLTLGIFVGYKTISKNKPGILTNILQDLDKEVLSRKLVENNLQVSNNEIRFNGKLIETRGIFAAFVFRGRVIAW